MKKIAFYVEGQTELVFINKLLIEIAGQKNIQIKLQQFQGNGRPPINIYPRTSAQSQNPKHFAYVFDCKGEGGVATRILQDYSNLMAQGYCEVIGLRDLFPLTLSELSRLQQGLNNGIMRNGRQITLPLPTNSSITVAVREVEDWFLAECNHYACIDANLTHAFIVAKAGFDPCIDDLTIRNGSAADDLKTIYQLVGKSWTKTFEQVDRTIECLDYANLYLNIRYKFAALDELMTKIDAFLT